MADNQLVYRSVKSDLFNIPADGGETRLGNASNKPSLLWSSGL